MWICHWCLGSASNSLVLVSSFPHLSAYFSAPPKLTRLNRSADGSKNVLVKRSLQVLHILPLASCRLNFLSHYHDVNTYIESQPPFSNLKQAVKEAKILKQVWIYLAAYFLVGEFNSENLFLVIVILGELTTGGIRWLYKHSPHPWICATKPSYRIVSRSN